MRATEYSYRAIFFPYAIVALKDGTFLPVNRNYKPLGISSRDMVDYESHPTRVKIKGLTASRAERLGLKVSADADRNGAMHYHLYNDATNPENSEANWKRYQIVLSKLMKLKVSPA